MIIAISVLIFVSLIPLLFKERIESEESDEVIPSLSSSLINDESSQTYFNISIKMNVSHQNVYYVSRETFYTCISHVMNTYQLIISTILLIGG